MGAEGCLHGRVHLLWALSLGIEVKLAPDVAEALSAAIHVSCLVLTATEIMHAMDTQSPPSAPVGQISPGVWRGVVEGVESGHCTARIEVRFGPGGCRIVDYEAFSDQYGLQHIEHGLLTEDSLHIAFGEAPGVTVFASRGGGVFASVGDQPMEVHIACDGEVLTWAWCWGTDAGDDVVERSRATCRRVDC